VFLSSTIAQIKCFRPSPSHPAIDSRSLRFSVKTFSHSALGGEERGGGVALQPEPALGGPGFVGVDCFHFIHRKDERNKFFRHVLITYETTRRHNPTDHNFNFATVDVFI
jgi:hypothetical protein